MFVVKIVRPKVLTAFTSLPDAERSHATSPASGGFNDICRMNGVFWDM